MCSWSESVAQGFIHWQYDMVGLLPTEGYTFMLWSVKVLNIQSIDETSEAGNLSLVQPTTSY